MAQGQGRGRAEVAWDDMKVLRTVIIHKYADEMSFTAIGGRGV